MLNKLAAVPDQKSDVVVHHVLTTLATNPYDVPLAMLYKFDESAEPTTLRLQGHSGLPEGHKLLVDVADIDSDQGLIPELRRAVCASEPIFIDHDDRFEAVPWRGWGAPSRKIAILPIRSPTRHFGYLVIGLNPYRPFDGPCCQFVNDLNRIVSTIVSAAITFELAETRREQLESDLAFSNLKLRHLVEHASVGMCHVSVDDGEILWANDRYFYLAGRSVVDHTTNHSFYDAYLDEDLPKVRGLCKELLTGVEHTNAELRVKRTYTSPNGEETPASIQILAFPYRDPESDQVKSIMACTTDISRLKWAQTFHARSAAQAREAKEQQEAFIDVVSHEMRNPLSAIVHCADAIIATAVGTKYAEGRGSHEALAEIVQNAKVVLQCSTHQRRILDDVLTLSKLKSMLLSIKPVSVDPLRMVSSIVGMFEAELNSNSIRCNVAPDPSLSDLAIDHVFLDTSRVTQIFINLLTNAIKFVKLSKEPTISITFGACKSYPRSFFPENMFWADGEPSSDVTKSSEWGLGEHVYLTFVVQDSGIGLSNNAIAKIFKRFSQAHVKTHVTYGGSGLGLYISKELAEKQGGEIGVTSVPGKGTKFGFYVKARRREEQPPESEIKNSVDSDKDLKPLSPQMHLLLVEDNLINQKVLSTQLRRAGCIVQVANHGLEALNFLEETTFDAVLMDSEMPILDGLAATRSIRQKELESSGLLGIAMTQGPRAGTRLPVIAVTANVRDEQIQAAMDAGSDDVVQKPFKVEELIDRLHSLIVR